MVCGNRRARPCGLFRTNGSAADAGLCVTRRPLRPPPAQGMSASGDAAARRGGAGPSGHPNGAQAGPAGGGLAALPVPLAGALRPLRPPSPGAANGVGSAAAAIPGAPTGLLGRPPSAGRSGTPGAVGVGELSPWSTQGGAGGPGLSSSLLGEDLQERVKAENRSAAAVEGLVRPRSARPQSGHKKFMARYGLEKSGLFAP